LDSESYISKEDVMFRKSLILTLSIILVAALAACSGLSNSGVSSTAASGSSTSSVNEKLGAGILSLEGTENAVTTEQADSLLFLWQGVSSLGTDNNTTDTEMAALYDQIRETLTADQVQAIQAMNLGDTEVSTLASQYGAGNAASAASVASSSQSAQGQPPADGIMMDVSGMPGGDPTMGGAVSGQSTTNSGTQTAAATSDLNLQFAKAVVTLLETRAKV
jgi:hypothetical protein